MRLKVFINYIIFVFSLIIILILLSNLSVLYNSVDDDRTRMESLYKEKNNHLDVIVLGPSSTFCSWTPIYAWQEYGMTSHTYAFGHLHVAAYKYAIKEFLKTQKPKLIILYTDAFKDDEMQAKDYILYHKFLIFMKFSKNKIAMINAISDESNLDIFQRAELYFPIIRYHSKWKLLFDLPRIEKFYKCVVTYFLSFQEGEDIPILKHKDVFVDNQQYNNISKEKIEIINDLFIYLKKLNIPVLMTNFPEVKHYSDASSYVKQIQRNRLIFKMAKDMGFDTINLIDFDIIEKMGIKNKNYVDECHFNYVGTYKYTKYLGAFIQKKYNIENKKNDIDYNDWDEEYFKYYNYVKKHHNIDIDKELNFNSVNENNYLM